MTVTDRSHLGDAHPYRELTFTPAEMPSRRSVRPATTCAVAAEKTRTDWLGEPIARMSDWVYADGVTNTPVPTHPSARRTSARHPSKRVVATVAAGALSPWRRAVAAVVVAAVAALGATAAPAAAADPATRPVGGQEAYNQRLVTTVDQPVIGTGMTAWGRPLTPEWVLEQSLALQPNIAGATAVIQPDTGILYTPAAGWSGVDHVQVTSSGTPTGGFVDVCVNVPNGLTNTVGDAFAYVAPTQDGGITHVLALDPANPNAESIEGNSFPAGVVYVTTTGGARYDPSSGLLWYVQPDASAWTGASYTYTAWDNDGNGATGTVTLEKLIPGSLVPDMWPPLARVPVNSGPVTLDVLANDVLPSGASVVAIESQGMYRNDLSARDYTPVVEATGTTVTFTPPPGFEGELWFTYSVLDGAGGPILAFYGGTTVDARVIVGDGPATFKDQANRSVDLADAKLNPLVVGAGVTTVVDVLANDELQGPPMALVALNVPAGWTVATTDDMKFAVTAPVGSNGTSEQFWYSVQDAAGRWSASAGESVTVQVDTVRAWVVRAHQFTWAGTAITIDPAAGNADALAAVGATELTFQAPLQVLPGEAVSNADGTLTFTPEVGFMGDVELTWVPNVELGGGANLTTTVHVLGPQAQDWGITFPVGTEGQVDDLLDGALWGTHADLTTYIDRWVADQDGTRSRDAVGTVGAEPAGGFTGPGQWSQAVVAIDAPTDLPWPDATLTAELQDPLGVSTFTGQARLRGTTLVMGSDAVQSSLQTYAAVTSDRLMGPVARVLVEVTPVVPPVVPPPTVVDPPVVITPSRATVTVTG